MRRGRFLALWGSEQRRHFFGRRRFDLGSDLRCTLDLNGRFMDVTPAWEPLLGLRREALVGSELRAIVHDDDWPKMVSETRGMTDGLPGRRTFEVRCRTTTGDWVWLEWAAQLASGEGLIYASVRDVTERKAREQDLERAALLDPLTGLSNRRGFARALERELAAAKRHDLRPGLVVVDLDHFKAINDRHGHNVGDKLLVRAAEILVQAVRASDLPARIGGDEFAVLLPDCDLVKAEQVTGKVVAALRGCSVEALGGPVEVSASAGVAVLGQRGVETAEELMTAADRAMYRAKERRASFVVHDRE
jgi:diguanylate cyclase (GGDEF)-like protein/PAS domain S-box-containing protein